MNELSVGSLFSGIGGIELGLERAGGFKTKWFVEQDLFCRAILNKHWPDVQQFGDITKIAWEEMPKIDVLTGGFPCQDISQAGKGKGIIEGKRSSLWKYYFEAIRILRPKFAIIENVPMLYKRGLNVVLADLAKAGYDAEWFCLSAQDIGAPHIRQRMFIIAHPCEFRQIHMRLQEQSNKGRQQKFSENAPSINSDSDCNGYINHFQNKRAIISKSQEGRMQESERRIIPWIITNDWSERIQRFKQKSLQGEQGFSWCKDVRRVEEFRERSDLPKPLFRGTRDGVPFWMDRIKSLGNAVVPQVAQFIGERINQIEKGEPL